MTSGGPSSSVFITGHYGLNNAGDEAILLAMVAHLRELRPGLRITVTSGTPEKTARAAGVESILFSDAYAMHDAVSTADLVIVGGGGIFHDYWGVAPDTFLTNNHWGISFYTGPCALAAVYGKPVMIYSAGAGPLLTENGRAFTRLACETSSAITVRDAASKQVLESIGVSPERVLVTADPAFGFSGCSDAELAREVSERKGNGALIAVAPRNWSIGVEPESWEGEFAEGLDLFLAEHEGTILFLPFARRDDPQADDFHTAERIRSRMKHAHRASSLDRELSPDQIRTVFDHSDMVVGVRLHSMILGMVSRIPVVAISYDSKVSQVMELAGLKDYSLDIGALNGPLLASTMARAITERRAVALDDLGEQARRNARIAIETLDQGTSQHLIADELAAGLRRGLAAHFRQGRDLRLEVRRLFGEWEYYRSQSLTRTAEAEAASLQVAALRAETDQQSTKIRDFQETNQRIEAAQNHYLSRLEEAEKARNAFAARAEQLAGELARSNAAIAALSSEAALLHKKLDQHRSAEQQASEENRALKSDFEKERLRNQGAERQRTEENQALRSDLQKERRHTEAAEGLRARTLKGLDQFHHRFTSDLAAFRSQRAWTVMIAIRKGYTRWARGGTFAFLKWMIGLPFVGPGELHEYELKFPDIWNFIPTQFQEAPATQANALTRLPRRAYDVVIFAIFDFEFRFQRPQQVAAQFARLGHRVFWISPSRYLPPNSVQPFEALPLRDNVWEVRLRGERPDLYGGHVTPEEADNVESSIAQLYRFFDISESCALLQFPYWRQAGLRLREKFGAKIIYDCMDDWQNWTAEPRICDFNLEEEKKLARECDLLVVSSTGLGERHLAAGHQSLLVRNGADFDFFANPRDQKDEIPKPVVGYYGAIANWFDVELLTAVAEARPQYSFVLIGQVHQIDVSRLQNLSNVYFLGEKSYREIPSYLAGFDTALIPFRVNELTRAVDPVKLYEYLSQGKPVVATKMAELEQAAGLIQIADNAEDFARKLDLAMSDKDPARKAKRIEFARANTWAARVAEIDRAISGRFPLVSILIVTYNCHEFVQPCLDSVERNTSWPNYEVILVDNHSTDGSAEIADQLAGANPRIRVIHSPENLGFAGANNLAAKSAQGDYLVFLNPDTVVTPGWVGRMVRHYETTPSVGAVAAVTNFSGNETKINFEYHDVLEMENFALKLATDRAGEFLEIAMAPLYCVLVSRAVWNQVGELDQEFEVGMFEDDDFSLRLKNAGYRILAAEDCFIHHFGNGSFSKLPSEEAILRFERNQQRFESKWKMSWRAHTLRPKVRSPYDEIRFTAEEFYRVGSAVAPRHREPIVLRRLHPGGTTAGTAFNPQPGGDAAIVVECSNVTPGTVVVMGSQMLASSYGNEHLISAIVPRDLYAHPGNVPVKLLNDFGESNMIEFEVHGRE